MKNIVFTYGLIAGAIVSIWLVVALAIGMDNLGGDMGMVYGFSAMIIAFAFIFIAIKKYREQHDDLITFPKGFMIGLYISLVASTIYVVTWLISYYYFVPDFTEVYTSHVLEQLKHDGASAAELAKKTAEMEQFKEMYKNPLVVILYTYIEILPVGLLISLISAAILKRNERRTANQVTGS